MAKTIKNIIKEVGLAKNTQWGAPEEANGTFELTKPDSAARYRARWGELFVKDCRQKAKKAEEEGTEIETVEDFCDEYCIDRKTLWDWKEKDPVFAKSYRIGTMLLGNKAFKGIKHKIYEPNKTASTLHHLDRELWGPIDKYNADLKATTEEANKPTRIGLYFNKPRSLEEIAKDREAEEGD
jgi:hypothetical protein